MQRITLLALLLALVPLLAGAREDKPEPNDYKPMFNGKDLTGWVNVNNAPGTFYVKDNMIVTTGKPTGFMRTAKMYENFVMEVEWMHVPPKADAMGNSGIFVWADPLPAIGTPFSRAIEVQVLVNYPKNDWATNHGDIFSIWGAKCTPDRPHPTRKGLERCLPSEDRAKGANEWNHYKITGKDGAIKLEVNGKEVSGVSKCTPRKGYLALEAEGSECRFKNLKIKELPSTKPDAKEVCDEAKGHVTLFTGINLDGWNTGEQKANWKVGDNRLSYDGKAKDGGVLKTEKEYGDFELVIDVNAGKDSKVSLDAGGDVPLTGGKPGAFSRYVVTCQGGSVTVSHGDTAAKGERKAGKGPITLKATGGANFMNLFVRELK